MTANRRERNKHGPRNVTPAGQSVFHDLFPAEQAAELEIRAALLRGLERWLISAGRTQTDAAAPGTCVGY